MEDEFFEDLMTAGHEIKARHPDIDFEDWTDNLMRQYPTEIVDALGTHPDKIHASLVEIWERPF